MNIEWTSRPVIAGNLEINYARGGSGEPLVFLHGWPEFNRTWMRNLPVIAKHYDVIAPDLRGFGRSRDSGARRSGGTPPDMLARDLLVLTEALGLEKFAIVSHDVGSVVAQLVARAVPERVSALFFFNCVYPGIGRRWAAPEHMAETWYQQFHQKPFAAELVGSSREATRLYFGAMLAHWSYDSHAFDDVLDEWVDNFRRPGNIQGGFDWYVGVNSMRMKLMTEGAPELPPIPHKTCVLWGEHDPVIRIEWSDRLDEYFADLEFECATEAGHFVHFEQAELANARMLEFFGKALG